MIYLTYDLKHNDIELNGCIAIFKTELELINWTTAPVRINKINIKNIKYK